jgi:hypothetical protein
VGALYILYSKYDINKIGRDICHNIVACLLKTRIVKPAETAVASHHVMTAIDAQATTEERVEAVFSMRSVPRLCSEDRVLRRQLEEYMG